MPAPRPHDLLADLDDLSPAVLVRTLLDDPQAELEFWQVEPAGGGASSSQVYFASGRAGSGGRTVPFSLVIKTFGTGGEDWHATSGTLGAWDYWKREWLVYGASWLPDLPGRVVGARAADQGSEGPRRPPGRLLVDRAPLPCRALVDRELPAGLDRAIGAHGRTTAEPG